MVVSVVSVAGVVGIVALAPTARSLKVDITKLTNRVKGPGSF